MRVGVFGNYDDRESAPIFLSMSQQLANARDAKWMLRHEHDIGAASDSAICGDPASVTSHYFNNHNAVMRFGSGVQTIDGVGNDADGGVKAEGKVRAVNVVVDCLRNSNQSQLVMTPQIARGRERAFATDDY